MYKKIIIILLLFFLFGCVQKERLSNSSKTYLFFKNFDVNHYYVSFFDRNVSKNDDTKINIARDNDKYYYEVDGQVKTIIIQKNGICFTISGGGYYKKEKDVFDYSLGIIPSNIDDLKKLDYKTGKESVFGKKYVYEKYIFDKNEVIYYYRGSKLIYIKYKSFERTGLLRFNFMKDEFDNDIFNAYEKYDEIVF